MKKRVFLSLLALFFIFATGAGVAIFYITNITGSLGRLLNLHQVEYLRQNLVINLQTVQADLYRARTPLATELDGIVENVDRLDRVAASCLGCHHRSELELRIVEMKRLIEAYKDAISFYITAAANEQRIETLKRDATEIGDRLLGSTQGMALEASETLQEATRLSLVRISRAKVILFVTVAAAGLLVLAVARHLVRFIGRPVDALLDGTRAIQAGDLGHRIDYRDRTEFGELAENFNRMSAALQEGQESAARQQQALRESEWKFRTLSEFSNDWEYWLGADKQLVYISGSCERMTGYPPDEFQGRLELIDEIIHPDDRRLYEGHLANGRTVGLRELEFRIRCKSGEQKWVSHVCGPIFDDGQFLGRFASNRDITDRKLLEERLAQSQKMESLGLLAGGIAHDFNNLLTAILGFASVLEMRLQGGDEKSQRAVSQITRAGERAKELTGSLLAFSRKQIMRPEIVDINEVIAGLKPLLERIIGEDVVLTMAGAREELFVLADANQLEHVLINLSTNARDAMPEGGKLDVWVDAELVGSVRGRLGTSGAGDYVVLSVRDNGVGMGADELAHIFEPFFTSKEKRKGTGLGLSTVHGIVEQHGGFVEVHSEIGRGTEFRIFLPRMERPVRAATAGSDREMPDGSPASRGDGTLLIAEDEESVRALLVEVLEESGYRVIVAVDGDDAIRKYDENRETIDLALLDVVMPHKNGKEVYEYIRQADSRVGVIFMSGYTRDILTSRGISEQGLEVLQKPLEAPILLARIKARLPVAPRSPVG